MADTAQDAIVATYGTAQRRAVLQTSITVERLWRELDSANLTDSWLAGIGQAVVRAVAAGQLVAASTGQPYVDAMVSADGLDQDYAAGAATVSTRALSGIAADGRPLESLLYLPVIRTKTLLGAGMSLPESRMGGLVDLRRMVASEVADAGSAAAGVAMTANRQVTGYIRKVGPGACSRCVVLSGRWYRYSADFLRHKNCQCYGVPSIRGRPGHTPDPHEYFDSLSTAEQDRRFTADGARAIRDGADIYQVVNARRGMSAVDAYGRRVLATLEGTSPRSTFYRTIRAQTEARQGIRYARTGADLEQGLPRFQLRTNRLMPSEIYKLTEDRDELIRLLNRFGYIQ